MFLDRFSLRQLVFGLMVFGMLGLLAELVLLEHYEDWQQWIPLMMLGAGLLHAGVLMRHASPGVLKSFRALMIVYVAVGGLGLYFHLTGNMEFALERDATLSGIRLLLKSAHGGTPILAPGALTQLGLLGLAYVYRHPALGAPATTRSGHDE